MIALILILARMLAVLLALAAAAWLLYRVARMVVRTLPRPAAAILFGLLAGLFAGIVAERIDGTDAVMTGAIAGLMVAGAALAAMRWQAGRRIDRGDMRPSPPPDPIEPAADMAVTQAWRRAGALLPTQRSRLAAARRSCAAVLHKAAGGELDFGVIDAAHFVRSSVPDLVAQTAHLWEGASADERQRLTETLLSGLDDCARRADLETKRERQALRDRLAALRNHIANRAGGD